MFRKSMIVLALVTTTAGAAFAQPTTRSNVWGAHFDVPDQGAGRLFGGNAASAWRLA